MGDVEIVGLRTSRRRVCAERVLGILFATRDQVVIVAYADDLDGAVEHAFEIRNDGRGELDGPLLPRDMRRMGVTDKPVVAAIDPHIHAVAGG